MVSLDIRTFLMLVGATTIRNFEERWLRTTLVQLTDDQRGYKEHFYEQVARDILLNGPTEILFKTIIPWTIINSLVGLDLIRLQTRSLRINPEYDGYHQVLLAGIVGPIHHSILPQIADTLNALQ